MTKNIFEQIKKVNAQNQEYWSARELGKILGYSEYRFFVPVIEKAKKACENSGFASIDHFEDVHDMVTIGSGAERSVSDVIMSRYACYLTVQSADSGKVIVGKAKTYFAIQTRRQETSDQLVEDTKRVFLREEMKGRNKDLASAAKTAGVTNYSGFQDAGYIGLYGGLRQKDIKDRKKLPEKASILDHMGSEELAANLFRATQAEAKLKREKIRGQDRASHAHHEVGKKVRATIAELGGTMPEKLPSVEHVKESRKRVGGKKKLKMV